MNNLYCFSKNVYLFRYRKKTKWSKFLPHACGDKLKVFKIISLHITYIVPYNPILTLPNKKFIEHFF